MPFQWNVPLVNLLSLELTDQLPENNIDLALALRGCPRLETLFVRHLDSHLWPEEMLFSKKLKTVRLFITGAHIPRFRLSVDLRHWTYSTITTLALYNHPYQKFTSSATMNSCLQNCEFPNLRALTLEGANSDILDVFQFIHRHATLLEVNVSTSAHVRPEAVLKLIDGTGTWKVPSGTHFHSPICDICVDEENSLHLYPPDIVTPIWGHLCCNDFAFVRVPLSAEATSWQLPVGSSYQRYTCISLAFEELVVTPEDMIEDSDHCNILEFLLLLPNHVPQLQEFRFVAVGEGQLAVHVLPWMVVAFPCLLPALLAEVFILFRQQYPTFFEHTRA
jgi:hypothetical protein